jgi:hypothetical protein
MSSRRHHSHKGGTTPTTEPKDRPGVVQFSVSEVVQFSMSLDTGLPFGPGLLAGMRFALSRQSGADPFRAAAHATADPRV